MIKPNQLKSSSPSLHQLKKQQGLTLIEIMVVVVILGVLASMIIPNIVGRPDDARETVLKSDLAAISSALELFKLDNFTYPSTDQGLEALVQNPGDLPNWNQNGYLKKLPKDPWGRDYIYLSPADTGPFDIITLGADGLEGGEGPNADIALSSQ